KRIEGFKQRYRTYDLLLVDDVQFFEHKERIQEEFFHTFNSLYEAGSQIVMSSDRPPRDIATLEERLRSRFEWGLITDIQPPDLVQLSMDELCGDKRSHNIVYPRQVAMYLSRELTDSSLPKIGKEFGGRDHTTVIHATSKIARLIREDRSVYNLVQELTARVKQVR